MSNQNSISKSQNPSSFYIKVHVGKENTQPSSDVQNVQTAQGLQTAQNSVCNIVCNTENFVTEFLKAGLVRINLTFSGSEDECSYKLDFSPIGSSTQIFQTQKMSKKEFYNILLLLKDKYRNDIIYIVKYEFDEVSKKEYPEGIHISPNKLIQPYMILNAEIYQKGENKASIFYDWLDVRTSSHWVPFATFETKTVTSFDPARYVFYMPCLPDKEDEKDNTKELSPKRIHLKLDELPAIFEQHNIITYPVMNPKEPSKSYDSKQDWNNFHALFVCIFGFLLLLVICAFCVAITAAFFQEKIKKLEQMQKNANVLDGVCYVYYPDYMNITKLDQFITSNETFSSCSSIAYKNFSFADYELRGALYTILLQSFLNDLGVNFIAFMLTHMNCYVLMCFIWLLALSKMCCDIYRH